MKTYLVTYTFRRRKLTGRIAATDAKTAQARFQQANPDVFIVGIRLA